MELFNSVKGFYSVAGREEGHRCGGLDASEVGAWGEMRLSEAYSPLRSLASAAMVSSAASEAGADCGPQLSSKLVKGSFAIEPLLMTAEFKVNELDPEIVSG